MTNSGDLSSLNPAGSSLASRLASHLTFPVVSLSDALEQLGTSLSGIAIRSSLTAPGVVRITLDRESAEATRLEQTYFPLQSEQQLAVAIAAERGNFRPVGNWVPPE
jgi:hypothetical protein